MSSAGFLGKGVRGGKDDRTGVVCVVCAMYAAGVDGTFDLHRLLRLLSTGGVCVGVVGHAVDKFTLLTP